MQIADTLKINFNNFINGTAEFSGTYIAETGEINFSTNLTEREAIGEIRMGEGIIVNTEVILSDLSEPLNEQVIRAKFNEEEVEVNLNSNDINNLISAKELGNFASIMETIKRSSENAEFVKICERLKENLTRKNFINSYKVILDGDVFNETQKNIVMCIIAILSFIVAFIGLITCAGLVGCVVAAAAYALATAGLAGCFI
ncbi:MAG: hypothetical protein FJ213_01390 [Ignavibacteria bacterium]|nr:hypothetical protein [Ignavibacteria bacterium]